MCYTCDKIRRGSFSFEYFISYRFYIGWSELASWKLIKMYQNINQFPFLAQDFKKWTIQICLLSIVRSYKMLMIRKQLTAPWIIKLPGFASYLFYQYHCLRVNRVYARINTFLPPYSKRLFIAMIHRKVFYIKIVNIHFKWRKFLRNIRE